MSIVELSIWQAYVKEQGPLNTALRVEWAIARGLAFFGGGKLKPRDFAPFPREPEVDQPSSPEAVVNLFRRLAAKTRIANGKP